MHTFETAENSTSMHLHIPDVGILTPAALAGMRADVAARGKPEAKFRQNVVRLVLESRPDWMPEKGSALWLAWLVVTLGDGCEASGSDGSELQ